MKTLLNFLAVIFCSHAVLIPNPQESPHPVNSHELICHYGLPVTEAASGNSKNIKALTPAKTSHEVIGYLCSKTIWESKCDEGFLGGDTITYTLHKSPVSDSECTDAYRNFKAGETAPSPYFPPSYCSWMATNTKSLTFVTLTRYPVYIDPYENVMVDNVFLGHKCNSLICRTHYDNIKWITGDRGPSVCTQWYTVDGVISYDNTKSSDSQTAGITVMVIKKRRPATTLTRDGQAPFTHT